MPELKQLEQNAKDNAASWKDYEETEEFRKVYQKKTTAERAAVQNAELARADDLDDEDCTVDPPQI